MRALLPLAAIAVLALLLGGCGSNEETLESLAGTPAAINIVKDVEAMAHACKKPSKKSKKASAGQKEMLMPITGKKPRKEAAAKKPAAPKKPAAKAATKRQKK